MASLVAITFWDGSVGIYNLSTGKWLLKKLSGHTETIFDCAIQHVRNDAPQHTTWSGLPKDCIPTHHAIAKPDSRKLDHRNDHVLCTVGHDGVAKVWSLSSSLSATHTQEQQILTARDVHRVSRDRLCIQYLDSFPVMGSGVMNEETKQFETKEGSVYSVSFAPQPIQR
jgi:WD40 repeat protein